MYRIYPSTPRGTIDNLGLEGCADFADDVLLLMQPTLNQEFFNWCMLVAGILVILTILY